MSRKVGIRLSSLLPCVLNIELMLENVEPLLEMVSKYDVPAFAKTIGVSFILRPTDNVALHYKFGPHHSSEGIRPRRRFRHTLVRG